MGGIIGGIGTLIAVIFTTHETRKIQNESNDKREKDKLDVEYIRRSDIERDKKKERKAFTDSIVDSVGIYMTHIYVYFYNSWIIESNSEQLVNNLYELKKVREEIIRLDGINSFGTAEELIGLKLKEFKYKNDVDRINTANDKYFIDRTVANEHYFRLKIKLQKIQEAEELLNQLQLVHHISFGIQKFTLLIGGKVVNMLDSEYMNKTITAVIEEEIQKLEEIAYDFVENYVK